MVQRGHFGVVYPVEQETGTNTHHNEGQQIDQKTVSQTIDAMVQADPQLAWLKEAEKRGDVDWRLIKETHESFKYSHSSLGQGAMLAIIIGIQFFDTDDSKSLLFLFPVIGLFLSPLYPVINSKMIAKIDKAKANRYLN